MSRSVFRALEISGLSDPTYASSASNKHYVDTISSNLHSQIGVGSLQGTFLDNIGSDGTYGISGMLFVSSQNISGGHITTAYTASDDNDVVNKKYYTDNLSAGALAGNLVGNLSGASYTYGLKDMDFVSSQSISGGTITFNTFAGTTDATAVEIEELTDGSETTLHSHAGAASAPGGSFTANIGSDFTYGISGVAFVSSQAISGGTIVGNTITTTSRISSATGIIANYISANASNLAGTVTEADFKASSGTWVFVSSNRIWTDGYISSQQGIYTNFISANASNLSTGGGLDGSTVSSNFFLKSSGQTIWDWYFVSGINIYDISSVVHSNFLHSSNSNIHFAANSNLTANSISANSISGSFTTGDLTLNANTISGLIDPTWPSSATNKHYVDTISSNIVNNAIGSYYPSYLGHGLSLHSSNSDIHVKTTTHAVFASVSSTAGISGNWIAPLHVSKPTASNYPGQIIRTSGNANGTWVWMSVYNGSAYEWIQLGMST